MDTSSTVRLLVSATLQRVEDFDSFCRRQYFSLVDIWFYNFNFICTSLCHNQFIIYFFFQSVCMDGIALIWDFSVTGGELDMKHLLSISSPAGYSVLK